MTDIKKLADELGSHVISIFQTYSIANNLSVPETAKLMTLSLSSVIAANMHVNKKFLSQEDRSAIVEIYYSAIEGNNKPEEDQTNG